MMVLYQKPTWAYSQQLIKVSSQSVGRPDRLTHNIYEYIHFHICNNNTYQTQLLYLFTMNIKDKLSWSLFRNVTYFVYHNSDNRHSTFISNTMIIKEINLWCPQRSNWDPPFCTKGQVEVQKEAVIKALSIMVCSKGPLIRECHRSTTWIYLFYNNTLLLINLYFCF